MNKPIHIQYERTVPASFLNTVSMISNTLKTY